VEEEEQHHPAPGHAPSKHSEEEGRDGVVLVRVGVGVGVVCSALHPWKKFRAPEGSVEWRCVRQHVCVFCVPGQRKGKRQSRGECWELSQVHKFVIRRNAMLSVLHEF
jgi:hypothetical protein